MSSDDVCVIIPARDEARFVAGAVASARIQPEVRDIVVVDDGSQDDTSGQARGAGARVIEAQAEGVGAARQTGIEATTSSLVIMLDADDRLRPHAVQRLVAALAARPEAVLAYGEARTMDELGDPVGVERRSWFGARPQGDPLLSLLEANFIATPGAVCVRRAALERAGPWCRECTQAEDWEMWCRLALLGSFAYVPTPSVVDKRSHPRSASARRLAGGADAFVSVDRVFAHEGVRARVPASILGELRRRQEAHQLAIAAVSLLRRGEASAARLALLRALRRDPRRPREWVLLACALAGRLPAAVASRLR